MHYSIDPLWKRVMYGTIYADQWLRKLIWTIFGKNSIATWKLDVKPYSRIVNNKMSMIQLAEKTFCFSYWNYFMEITRSSFLPYSSGTIIRPHLTLLTSCILVAIFPTKEVLAPASELSQARISVDIMTRNKNAL